MANWRNRLSRREVNRRRNSRNEGEMREMLPGGFEKPDAHALRGEWHCTECGNTCLVIRGECRCLCGHRLKEHTNVRKRFRNEKDEDKSKQIWYSYKCAHPKCKCNHFFYIVGEGAWILRCRCKHKHTEHDPVSFKCARASCACAGFDSPWVCNCNHPWSAHDQRMCAERRREDAQLPIKEFFQITQEPLMAEKCQKRCRPINSEVSNLQTLRRDPSNIVDSDKELTGSYSYNNACRSQSLSHV